jgi:predicted signal transduction protein with EAL and GGDEF domain
MSITRALRVLAVTAVAERGIVLWTMPSPETFLFHSAFGADGTARPLPVSQRVAIGDLAPGHERALRDWVAGGCHGTFALPSCRLLGAASPVYLRRLTSGGPIHGTAELDSGSALDFWEGGFRRLLIGRLSEAVRAGRPMTLGLITIRGFAFVRDGAGHAVAQAVMADLRERLVAAFGSDVDIGPFHSDVFAFVAGAPQSGSAPEESIRQRLTEAFAAPFEIDSMTYRLTANAGIALFPDDCDCVDDLLRAAEIALDRAKHGQPDAVLRCRPQWLEEAKGSLLLAVDIYTGMANNCFVPHFQPIVDLRTGHVTGAEVLMRWNHPVEGTLAPDRFIPIAERHGLITDLTLSLLRQLGRLLREHGMPPHRLSVNLSATDLTPVSMRRILNDIDNESLLPPDRLTFEITETALAAEPDVARTLLAEVRARGTKVAIDDFGVGYSSFGALGGLPVDTLKIDRSFVAGIEERDERRRLVNAICAMSAAFGLTTIAEGVETEAAADTLRGLGVNAAQGYLYARPMPIDRYYAWLNDRLLTP